MGLPDEVSYEARMEYYREGGTKYPPIRFDPNYVLTRADKEFLQYLKRERIK